MQNQTAGKREEENQIHLIFWDSPTIVVEVNRDIFGLNGKPVRRNTGADCFGVRYGCANT